MNRPVLRQCRGPGCRAWIPADLDLCPFCGASDKWARVWTWMDPIIVLVCLASLAGLAYRALS